MDKIKINIWQLSVDDKVRWAGAITQAISRDASLPCLAALAKAVKESTADLQTAYRQTMALRKDFLEKESYLAEVEDRWNRVMTEVVQKVKAEAKDDAEKLAVVGFSLHTTSRPEAVAHLAVSAGDSQGTLNLVFDPVRGADAYEVQSNAAPHQQPWSFKAVSLTSKITLSGLSSGHRCWVRVRPIGPTGIGPWSDSVSKIVP